MNKLFKSLDVKPQMLSDLMSGLGVYSADVEVTGFCDDTRKLQQGDAFLCLPRAKDVEALVTQAMNKGASAVVFVGQPQAQRDGLACACLPDMNAAGLLLRRWFGTESSSVLCFGITGTDGKTSVAWMLREVLAKHLASAWSVGTLGWMKAKDDVTDLGNTTPSLIRLHQIYAQATQQGIAALVLEVSSHGIAQERIAGLPFAAAIWTTMGHDHLEDHGSFEAYLGHKTNFIKGVVDAGDKVVANADYTLIQQALEDVKEKVSWYASSGEVDLVWHVDVQAENGQVTLSDADEKIALTQVPAVDFHVENLAAVALLMSKMFGLSLSAFKTFDGEVSTPMGRLEPVGENGNVLIDYAHTAEGLTRCLQSARKLTQGQLLLVFGCGGNRDKAKRPEMGAAAVRYSDICWLTSDNPRDEAQADIADDVLAGMGQDSCKVHVIEDREQAIQEAVCAMNEQDKLVIAGKGHESYMEISGSRLAWSDKEKAIQAIQACEVRKCA